MEQFWNWAKRNGIELKKDKDGNIPLEEFDRNKLPMIVQCTMCTMTFLLPGGYIDDEGYTYCSGCGSEINDYNN